MNFFPLTQICTKSLDVPITFWPCLLRHYTCELGFNYQDPPEVFLLFLLHYAKNMKKDQVFMSPPTKASNMLTPNNKFGKENLVLVNVF